MVSQVHFMRCIDARNTRKCPFAHRHQLAFRDSWIGVRRWWRSIFHPLVHVGDQRAPEPLDRIRIVSLLGGELRRASRSLLWWKRGGKMLQSGEKIDARIFISRRVFQSVGGGMNQRSGTAPVFIGSIAEENLWRGVRLACSIQKACGFTGLRVSFGEVSVGEHIRREEEAGHGLRVTRGLRESMIETAPARAGHMRNHAVYHLSPLLVGVEVLIEKMAEEAATLRNSYRIDAADRSRGLGIVLEIREEIADRSQPGAHNHRVFRFIDDLINFARQKTAIQVNEMRIAQNLAFHGTGKAPLAARDYLPRSTRRGAYRKGVFRAGKIVDRITFPSTGAQHDVPQGHVVPFFGWREVRAHQAANFFSSWIMSNRGGEPKILSLITDIKLPAEPRNRVAFAQQKSVAEFRVWVGRISSVYQAQNSSPAAIRDFEQHGIVSLGHVLRFEEIEVCGKLDFPLGVARRFIEIHDLPVVNVFWMDREVDPPDDSLVSASQSERPPVLDVRARNDLHTRDMRVSR